ncbi:MAG: transketolase family protein [Oscillospiraceae bacterium]|jgi:transketolase|nr:transketolase family protein [Oscillospiraceae bacterium]
MSVIVRETFEKEPHMLRETYCNGLMALAETDPRIVALDADLMSSSGMKPFWKKYPDRFINCGIAEANMVGVAAGLSATGKIPFAHTFGTFASRRVCDQVFMSAAYAKLNVRIVGTDPGVTAAFNGGTHMPLEDMAVLRAIPEIILVEPTDSVQLEAILPQLISDYGTYYIRLQRKNAAAVYAPGSTFEIGRGDVLRSGKAVTLIASGILVSEALKAAELLAGQGVDARVINLFTWKPIDRKLIEVAARETGAIVTCENHNIVGGLGSAVAEVVGETWPVPIERIGTPDVFGEVGPEDYLRTRFHLNAVDIAAAATKAVARKR